MSWQIMMSGLHHGILILRNKVVNFKVFLVKYRKKIYVIIWPPFFFVLRKSSWCISPRIFLIFPRPAGRLLHFIHQRCTVHNLTELLRIQVTVSQKSQLESAICSYARSMELKRALQLLKDFARKTVQVSGVAHGVLDFFGKIFCVDWTFGPWFWGGGWKKPASMNSLIPFWMIWNDEISPVCRSHTILSPNVSIFFVRCSSCIGKWIELLSWEVGCDPILWKRGQRVVRQFRETSCKAAIIPSP